MQLSTKTLLALLPYFLQVQAGASGTGTTTRYWDCCKPSCAWSGKTTLASGASPVGTCDINDSPLSDPNAVSGCDGGSAYMCSNESPWAVTDDLAYGYAAVNIAGGSEDSWCCACYELTFTSGAIAGKKMIVQATNTGGDLGSNQFDISMPGGGVGIFNGCTTEWGAPSSGWGAQYGGISAATDCSSFPEALQAGCNWRFDWFAGCDNPTVSFTQVACPAAITKNSGCIRADDTSEPAAPAPSGSAVASSAVVETTSSAEPESTSASPVASTSEAVSETTSASPVAETTESVIPIASTSQAVPVATSSDSGLETSSADSIIPSSTSVELPATTSVSEPTSISSAAAVTTSAADYDDVCEL